MNCIGIIIGFVSLLVIGMLHPIVIWLEYHFSKRIWYVFLIVGIGFLVASIFVENIIVSCVFGVTAAGLLWGIRELFQQEKRVQKGWFPKKSDREEK